MWAHLQRGMGLFPGFWADVFFFFVQFLHGISVILGLFRRGFFGLCAGLFAPENPFFCTNVQYFFSQPLLSPSEHENSSQENGKKTISPKFGDRDRI